MKTFLDFLTRSALTNTSLFIVYYCGRYADVFLENVNVPYLKIELVISKSLRKWDFTFYDLGIVAEIFQSIMYSM